MPAGPVLVVNAGSTSTKLSVIAPDDSTVWSRDVDAGLDEIGRALGDASDAGDALDAVVSAGHRIVHGGPGFTEPVLVDDAVLEEIDSLRDLAPLHNEAGLAGIRAARARFPDIPQVACFDTAFHATLPDAARAYGGPYRWLDHGYRRYGFHGLSHQYATERAAELLDRPASELRLVTCHLGGGCSLAAVDRGASVDTTMGFTPLDGLVMATRSGSVDPGLLLHLLRNGTTVAELDETLERRSGVLGLSGVSADLRDVLAARDRGDDRARLAIDVFVHRLVAGIGSMIATLRGADALVFTGGIGDGSAEIRTRAADAFSWLDPPVRVLAVKAREDLVIARATRAITEGADRRT